MECTAQNRPAAVDDEDPDAAWTEIVIMPFDRAGMAPDGAWLQWMEEECIVIPSWLYCLLGLVWPLLRLFYRKSLEGQHTDYWFFGDRRRGGNALSLDR
jgi:hypothetical protein